MSDSNRGIYLNPLPLSPCFLSSWINLFVLIDIPSDDFFQCQICIINISVFWLLFAFFSWHIAVLLNNIWIFTLSLILFIFYLSNSVSSFSGLLSISILSFHFLNDSITVQSWPLCVPQSTSPFTYKWPFLAQRSQLGFNETQTWI